VDVKGMKAQGNRLSFHSVQRVRLQTEELDLATIDAALEEKEAAEELTPDHPIAEKNLQEPKTEEQTEQSPTLEKAEPQVKEAKEKETRVKEAPKDVFQVKRTKEVAPKDDLPLEITNPDDIQMDDHGQLGLFGNPEKED